MLRVLASCLLLLAALPCPAGRAAGRCDLRGLRRRAARHRRSAACCRPRSRPPATTRGRSTATGDCSASARSRRIRRGNTAGRRSMPMPPSLVIEFIDVIGENGWEVRYLEDIDVSIALPFGRLGPARAEEGGERRWSDDARLRSSRTASPQPMPPPGTTPPRPPTPETTSKSSRLPDLLVTGGMLRDGRPFHTRSDRRGDVWATVYLASDPAEETTLGLIAAQHPSRAAGAVGPSRGRRARPARRRDAGLHGRLRRRDGNAGRPGARDAAAA